MHKNYEIAEVWPMTAFFSAHRALCHEGGLLRVEKVIDHSLHWHGVVIPTQQATVCIPIIIIYYNIQYYVTMFLRHASSIIAKHGGQF